VRYGLPEEEDSGPNSFEELLEHPVAQQVLGHLDALLGSLPFAKSSLPYPFTPDPALSPHYQGPDRGFASSTDRRPPPGRAAPPPKPAAPDPRLVLHFGPNDPITRAEIEKRRRELARLCHPDKGGSTEAMQRINQAADALLAQLR
jgi:hypothetical protein